MPDIYRRVTLTMDFTALMPDDDAEGDARSDEISDAVVAVLEQHTPRYIFDGSISVTDWDDRPELDVTDD